MSVETTTSLRVAACKRDAAVYAVEHWHYSKTMPVGRLVHHGVWERERFIGAVLYGRGANNHLGSGYGLPVEQVCELVRVALREHAAPVSQIVAESLRLLKRSNPGLRLVVSYADPAHGHHGGIYQAGNWLYVGESGATPEFLIHGQQMHMRSLHARHWRQSLPWIREHVDRNADLVPVPAKHRYLMPLDRATSRRVRSLALPYPPAATA